MSDRAGGLPQDLLELTLRSMPIGLSVADQDDVVLFWAGAGFGTCSPKLIGRDLHACHSKQESGTRSTPSSTAPTAPSASSTRPCATPRAPTAACWRPSCR